MVLLRIDGTEELSGDFEWRVEELSPQPGLDLHALLGTHATVAIDHSEGNLTMDKLIRMLADVVKIN